MRRTSFRAKRDDAAMSRPQWRCGPGGSHQQCGEDFLFMQKKALPREGLRPIPQAEKSVI